MVRYERIEFMSREKSAPVCSAPNRSTSGRLSVCFSPVFYHLAVGREYGFALLAFGRSIAHFIVYGSTFDSPFRGADISAAHYSFGRSLDSYWQFLYG